MVHNQIVNNQPFCAPEKCCQRCSQSRWMTTQLEELNGDKPALHCRNPFVRALTSWGSMPKVEPYEPTDCQYFQRQPKPSIVTERHYKRWY